MNQAHLYPRDLVPEILNEHLCDVILKRANANQLLAVQTAARALQACGSHVRFNVSWQYKTEDGLRELETTLWGTVLYTNSDHTKVIATKHQGTILYWEIAYSVDKAEWYATMPELSPPGYR